jgi:hypothetical protein
MTENFNDQLEIYIDYSNLKASDLGKLLINLSYLSNKISEDYFTRFDTYQGEQMPTLNIQTIDTGNSVKFTLVEGWKPSIKTSADDDIVIEIPKLLGIPILIGYFLIYAASSYLDIQNKRLDNHLKELEIQLKEKELAKAINSPNEETEKEKRFVLYYLDNKVAEIKPLLNDTIKSILRNPEINKFKVNNIEIKDLKNSENDF